jgi:hypothetical protein
MDLLAGEIFGQNLQVGGSGRIVVLRGAGGRLRILRECGDGKSGSQKCGGRGNAGRGRRLQGGDSSRIGVDSCFYDGILLGMDALAS